LGVDSVVDAAGNTGPGTAATGTSVTVDRTAPTVSAFSATTPTRGSPIAYTLTFDEPVSGLAASDFATTGTSDGWTVTSITGSGATYTVNLGNASPSDGTVVLTLASGSVSDAAGNTAPATAAAANTVTFDGTPPAAEWALAATPTNASVSVFTLSFNTPVTGIAAGDFTNRGTATGCTFSPSATSGTSVTVSASGCSEGSVIVRIAADSVDDAAGNAGPATAQDSTAVLIDRTAPAVSSFVSSSTTPSNAGTATFSVTFDSPVTGLAAGAFTPTGTSAGWSVDSLTGSGAGPYTVTLSAASPSTGTLGLDLASGSVLDAATNAGPGTTASATATISIDVTPPGSPSFTSGPSGDIGVTSASFEFTGAASGERYECQVDGDGPWTSCASPRSLSNLSDGSYSLGVRLVDELGNAGTPVTRSFTVDTTSPASAVSITNSLPVDGSSTRTTSATMTFTGSDSGETYSCSLDGSAWAACATATDPGSQPYTGLADGEHVFRVASTDAAGNRGPVSTRVWTVDTDAPTNSPVITAAPASPGSDGTPTFAFGGAATGETYVCAVDAGAFAPCTSPFTTGALADGSHTFRVALLDAAGNQGPSASSTIVIDTTAPSTTPTISSSPAIPGNDPTPSIAFTGAGAGETHECQVDGGAWMPCTSPTSLGPLDDGAITFSVRLVDAAGNTGSASTTTWTVDVSAPAPPTLTRTPSDTPTASTSASIAIAAAEADGTLQCSLDGAAWATCTSPRSLTGLADGSHTMRVRQVDAAGNAGAIASESWVVDTTAPSAAPTITAGPCGGVAVTTAGFAFTGAGTGEVYECSLDSGAWEACTSPVSLTGLADGAHAWSVRLVDAAGNSGPAATRSWTVFSTPPPPPDGSTAPASTSNPTSTFSFTGATTSTFECRLDGGAWTTCTSPFTTPELPDGSHTLEVRQVDGGGNISAPPYLEYTWVIDSQAPASVVFGNVPTSPTNATTAAPTMTISADVAGVATYSLECMVDGGPWQEPCPVTGTGPGPLTKALSGLGEGEHTLVARQRKTLADSSVTVSVESSIVWTIDLTPPAAPTVSSRPADPTNQTSGTFGISAPAATTLECRINDGAWAACTSPAPVSGLADGNHTFQTRAVDYAGNRSTATSVTWAVDTNAPGTAAFTSQPPVDASSESATFGFILPAGGASAMCALDGAEPVPCTAPYTVSGLVDGTHTLQVSVVDAAGNVGPATSITWTVDTQPPPAPAIATGPTGSVQEIASTFTFTGAAAGDVYQCNIDASGWLPCATPNTTSALAEGAHVLMVRTADAAGNVSRTDTREWTVDRTPPADTATLIESPANPSSIATPQFGFSGAAAPDTYSCRVNGGAWAPCTSPFTLPSLGDGTHSFEVALTDAAGNIGSPTTYAWFVDTVAPSSAPVILSSPSAYSKDLTPSIVFAGAGVGDTYACAIDSGTYAACTSPFTSAQLSSGAHAFRVALVDAAGNRGPDATRSWITVADPPVTVPVITSGPSGATSDSTPEWEFAGAGASETYECRMDDDPFAACTSPFTSSALADGTHVFEVRTVDQAGNGGTPLARTIIVDTEVPGEPSLSGAPSVVDERQLRDLGIKLKPAAAGENK
jgi:hypothetical protein